MNWDEFFPHQLCINLATRPDRWARVTARFAEQGLYRIRRFPAVDGRTVTLPPDWPTSPGAYGCLRSHLAVVEQARAAAWPSVLIFEDDVVLAPKFKATCAAYVPQVPADWDMLFFGALHGAPPVRVTDNVRRVTHSLSTYAYALNQSIYDSFIAVTRQALAVLDENTRALQKRFNCYCFMPHLAWVEEDYSDIRGEQSNLWWLKESLVLFGPEMDDILSRTAAVISYCDNAPGSRRNLAFLLDYFAQKLPELALLVVEHGQRPSLTPSVLPSNCQFHIVAATDSGQGNQPLKLGAELVEASKEFFIFLESNVFLTREDIRANLLKCRDHDLISACRALYELTERATERLLQGDVRWDYADTDQAQAKQTHFDSAFIITRPAINRLLAQGLVAEHSDDQLSLRAEELLRCFRSPNLARRLKVR